MDFIFDNNIPIYIQLANQLKIKIISGELSVGARLPSVRELALITKVNPNTMQRALTELEAEGLIYTERTNGKFVTTDISLINECRKNYAKALSDAFLKQMQNIGITYDDTIKFLQERK